MTDSFSRINKFGFFIKIKGGGNYLSKFLVLILSLLVSDNLLSKSLVPTRICENSENRYLAAFNKDTQINNQVVEFNSHPTDTSYSYGNPHIRIIEPSLIRLIIQREIMLDEIKYYDVNYIKTNKIKSLSLLTINSKSVTGEDSVGIKEIYNYDASGKIVKYEHTSLKDKDFFINEFIYEDGKLNQVIQKKYTEFNDTKIIDTFLVITDLKNNISQITPLSKTSDRCLASYSLVYDRQNKLKSIMRTVNCRIIDTTWTQFNRDHYGRVVDMSYGKCSQRFFARDNERRISEVVEIDCFEQNHLRNLIVSTRTYDDKTGNLSSINTDIHELGDDLHDNIRIYLNYGDVGVIEKRVEHNYELQITTKVMYEFF
jgi:hypothetical protein